MFARAVGLVMALAVASAGQAAQLDATTQAKIRNLQLERRDALKKAIRLQVNRVRGGSATLGSLVETSGELLEVELELATKAEERVAAHASHVELAKWAETFAEASFKAGTYLEPDFQRTRAARLKAEVSWLKAGGK